MDKTVYANTKEAKQIIERKDNLRRIMRDILRSNREGKSTKRIKIPKFNLLNQSTKRNTQMQNEDMTYDESFNASTLLPRINATNTTNENIKITETYHRRSNSFLNGGMPKIKS